MMPDRFHVLAVDQGTGSTKAVVVDPGGDVRQGDSVPLPLSSPRPGWVEQDPVEVLDSVCEVLRSTSASLSAPVAAVGLSTQRESALAWDTRTGEPVGPLLGWQDRRTADRADELGTKSGDRIRSVTGLPVDPMFSALKFAWLLDQVDPDRSRARRSEIRLGTVDSWLVCRLTGAHQIEAGNASRTQLLDIRTTDWNDELLELFDIPRAALPRIVRSDHETEPIRGVGAGVDGVRITGVLGDSHAALFAHGVRRPGAVKVTYGTGSSVMGLAGRPVATDSGLVETVAWQTDDTVRAFEGNILATGATLVWLGKLLDKTPDQLWELARGVEDSGGVNVVPAFAGLGAPWWDHHASAVIDGFGLGTTAGHLARAALDSIPLQIEDVLAEADRADGTRVETVLADGGPTHNDRLMQRQADLSDRRVLRPRVNGLSAVGAAHMAGLGASLWDDAALSGIARERDEFRPDLAPDERLARRASWARSLARSRLTSAPDPDRSSRQGERED